KRELDWEGLDCGCPVGAVAFSPDGKLFAAALNFTGMNEERAVRVWRVEGGKGTRLRDLKAGTGPGRQLGVATDNREPAGALGGGLVGLGGGPRGRTHCIDVWDVEKPHLQTINTPGIEVGPNFAFAKKVWLLAVARADMINFFSDADLKETGPQIN